MSPGILLTLFPQHLAKPLAHEGALWLIVELIIGAGYSRTAFAPPPKKRVAQTEIGKKSVVTENYL